jgi:dTDP-glucose 4,6-dehydratase/UDP-glucuronate decarboxylase
MLNSIVYKDCIRVINEINLKKFNGKKILILGGNSFIATYIQAILSVAKIKKNINSKVTSLSLNYPRGLFKDILYESTNINFIKIDLIKSLYLKRILNKKFDFIFHCATYGQPEKWKENYFNIISLSTSTLKLVLDHSKKFKSKVMYFSSADVYNIGIGDNKKIDENFPVGIPNHLGRSVYSGSKILGEKLCKIYKQNYNLPIYIVRPAHTYGPGQDATTDRRLIAQLTYRSIYKKNIYIHGKGEKIKTWGYIADITKMLLNIIQFGKSQTYNVAGNSHKSIYEIAKIFAKNTKKKLIRKKILKQQEHFLNSDASVIKINSDKYYLEFKNKKNNTNITKGISNLIKWNISKLKK